MNLADYIVIAVIAAILVFAAYYVYRSKKSGKKCIGCPDGCSSGSCQNCNSSNCSCKE